MINTNRYLPKRDLSRIVKNVLTKLLRVLIFAVAILLLYFPIIIIIFQSFNASPTGINFGGFTLKWYGEILKRPALVDAIINTITIAVISTLLSTILGTFFAMGINSLTSKKRQRMILLNNIPVLNAEIVTGVFLMLMFLLVQAILPQVQIFGYFTLLFAHVFFSIPYVVLSVLPKLNEIDDNLFDAAQDLGCTKRQAIFKVVLPSIKAGIIAGALIAFTMSIDDFVISYFTTGSGVQNFSIWIYTNLGKNEFRSNAIPLAYAYNTIISLGTLVGLFIYNIVKSIKRKRTKNKKEVVN